MKNLGTVLLFAVLVWSVTMADAKAKEPGYIADFGYSPLAQEKPSTVEVSFAMMPVGFKPNPVMLWFTAPEFANLPGAVKEDLTEILLAKGFSVRGAYDSFDLITYSDKKSIDLAVIPVLEMSITLKDHQEKLESIWSAPPVHNLTGNVEVGGKINLEMREISTRDLMWVKSIPFTKFLIPYSFRIPSYREGSPFDYGRVISEIAMGFESQYPDMMSKVYDLIDAEEMRIIKDQALEIKSKRGY